MDVLGVEKLGSSQSPNLGKHVIPPCVNKYLKDMNKTLNLNKTVYELCQEYPEVAQIMAEIGFKDITKPMALQTVGRIMTIPKGAAIKEIDLQVVIRTFEEEGFTVVRDDEKVAAQPSKEEDNAREAEATSSPVSRSALLQSYVKRLSDGEDLDSVRIDFVANFKNVDAKEIIQAEQELIRSGVPIAKVQKMCDVHSALFHGNTSEEDLTKQGVDSATVALMNEVGHPLNILYTENNAITALLAQVDTLLAENVSPRLWNTQLPQLQQITHHFGKKGDLIYPLLRSCYDVDAPYNVMWGVDDEIRDELHVLCKQPSDDAEWSKRLKATLTREQEMIYKENNILYPLCTQHFTEADWEEIRTEIEDYRPCLIASYPEWQGHKLHHPLHLPLPLTEEVCLGTGRFTGAQLEAMLNTMPYEITFIDANNVNRYFNNMKDEKLFKRPRMALDREVFDCHPPMVQPMVKKLLTAFRDGTQDKFHVWSEKGGHDVYISYFAVRDAQGVYLGTLECVQVMDFAKEHYRKN